jgi:hypothetical protein
MDQMGQPAQVRILLAPSRNTFFAVFFCGNNNNNTLLPTCQGLVQELFKLHHDFNKGTRGADSTCQLLCLLHLLVELIPESLDRLPVVNVHLVL